MKFTAGQKKVLELIQKSKGFLHLFPLLRVVVQGEALDKKHDIVRNRLKNYIYHIQVFVVSLRDFFTELQSHDKRQYTLLSQVPSLAIHFKNPSQAQKTKKLNELYSQIQRCFDNVDLDLRWEDIKNFTKEDHTTEFWSYLVTYYTESVCFEAFSPEKAKSSLTQQFILGELQKSINPASNKGKKLLNTMQIVLDVTSQQEQKHEQSLFDPKRMENKLMQIFMGKIEAEHGFSFRKPPKGNIYYQVGIIVVGLFIGFFCFMNSVETGLVATIALPFLQTLINDKIIIPHLQKQDSDYKAYLEREYKSREKKFEESTRITPIHVIEVIHNEKSSSEMKDICLIQSTIERTAGGKEEKYQIESEIEPEQQQRREPKRNKQLSSETKDLPKHTVQKTKSEPDEIYFSNGMVYRKTDEQKKSSIKPIHDGTKTLWGFLDEEKLAFVDKTEMKHFANVLSNGTYVCKNVHGKEGVKQLPGNTYIYDKQTKQLVLSPTKLRPAGTGARIASQRFFATRVIIAGNEEANPKRFRLDCFGTYYSTQQAHRPG